jgi:hypothetical protein
LEKKSRDSSAGKVDAIFGLHQREAHESFAAGAEADAGRHRDTSLA